MRFLAVLCSLAVLLVSIETAFAGGPASNTGFNPGNFGFVAGAGGAGLAGAISVPAALAGVLAFGVGVSGAASGNLSGPANAIFVGGVAITIGIGVGAVGGATAVAVGGAVAAIGLGAVVGAFAGVAAGSIGAVLP